MRKKFNALSQSVGFIVIILAALYGSLAFLGHEQVVKAALSNLEADSAPAAIPAVPASFNYRGTLRDSDGNLVANGNYDLTFKIYSTIGATEALFTQAQTGIIVRDGTFATTIENIPAATFTAGADRFIGVTVEPFAEMVPRERLSGVPYAVQAEDAHNGVPVGGVVDWWRPNANIPIPDGFVVCDGTVINDPLSPYHGQTTPDLRGKMVRGATPTSNELGTGGAESQTVNFGNGTSVAQSINSSQAPGHTHVLPAFTGSVSAVQLADPGTGDYWVRNDENNWTNQSSIAVFANPASQRQGEGNHYHALGGAASEAGSHAHQVTIPALALSGTQTIGTVPPYTNLLKICRTR